MTPPLVGLIGRARSGKDTLAAFLTASPYYFTRYAFADALKEAALGLDPLVGFEDRNAAAPVPPAPDVVGVRLSAVVGAYGWEAAKERPEVRRTLQALGVSMRTYVDSNVWVRGPLERALADGFPAVFTDVRFPNEAAAIKDAGGILVRVVRPQAPAISGAEHISETALDRLATDLVVDNSGTLDDLKAQARRVAHHGR